MNSQLPQVVGQWIVSLAISIVCCAILFLLFSTYIVDIKERANMTEIRLELLQEKYNQLATDMKAMRHKMLVHIDPIEGTDGHYKLVPVQADSKPKQMTNDKKGPLTNE
jgi:phosphate/sulfate permease